jgi:hypothetical protein
MEVKMRRFVVLIILFVLVMALSAEVKNMDEPAKGEHVFKIKKLWQVENAGEDPFGRIAQIRVSDKGIIYCHDNKNLRYYIFDPQGKLIGSFGKSGEGPGEIKRIEQAFTFLAGDKIAVQDIDRLHFFSWDGKFIKSVVNSRARSPIFFLNEDEFITAPRTILNIPEGNAKVKKINLKTGDEKVITEFSIFKGGTIQNQNVQAAMVVPTLTPMFIIEKYDNRLYFGMSDQYEIHISDLEGKTIGVFNLKREKSSLTEEEKLEPIIEGTKGMAPPDLIKALAKKLPNEETYFNSIQSHGGLIYVFKSYHNRKNIQQIDIFSPDGKYLYRGFIKVSTNFRITSGPVIENNYLYMALEDGDGEITLNKYEIILPE